MKNGLFLDEARGLLTGFCADPKTATLDVVEINPALDDGQRHGRERAHHPGAAVPDPAEPVMLHVQDQIASRVILVRPTGFGFDPETAASNPFQHRRERS